MDEATNLLETNSIFNKTNNCIPNTTINNNNHQTNKKNNNNNHNHHNNTKLIEFIHDLKEAIQNGEFQQANTTPSHTKINGNLQQQLKLHNQHHQQYETISNVNNLSNQTFSYIINWLKQQQFQIDDNKELATASSSLTQQLIKQEFNANTNCNSVAASSSSHVSIEIRMLKNQLRTKDDEKEKLFTKFKSLQEENIDLKAKLFNLKTSMSANNTLNYTSITNNNNNFGHQKCEKDYEIDRLKRIVDELAKSNDEKEKKIDDLNKQVQRFKRIQDLVLTAQNGKSKCDFDFNDINSDTNSLPSVNGIDEEETTTNAQIKQAKFNQQTKMLIIDSATKSAAIMETNKHTSTPPPPPQPLPVSSDPSVDNAKLTNPLGIANSVNQACSLISSCSLSSSMSSASSSTSSNSPTSSSPSLAPSNVNNLTAPLATISELISYNSLNTNSPNNSTDNVRQNSNKNMDHYNTLPRQLDSKRSNSNDTYDSEHNNSGGYRTATLGKLNSKTCLSETTSSNTITNEEINSKTPEPDSVNTTSTEQWVQKEAQKLNKNIQLLNNRKGSVSSLNDNSNESQSHVYETAVSSPKKTAKSNEKSNCTSPMHSNSSNNKGLRNFFGKLIRTSLVNINESNFNVNNETNTNVQTPSAIKQAAVVVNQVEDSSSKQPSLSSSKNNNNIFRRGGTRATASARLQNSFSISNNSLLQQNCNDKVTSSFFSFNLDTLAFSKLNSVHCYDWLCKNGFECYFPKSPDGTYANKWLKNGLHLLKASKYEYEKELGIKNPLHRKKLSLLLQSMYDKNNINLADINLLNCIDYQWVTKWLDDIGLPQYKVVFSESKIDGLMLNILSIDDLIALNINSELHYLSIKRGIHVLRINNFDTHCLRRRPSGDDLLDKSEVSLWTNHRVMEWLRSIDLSEYAPNLRGSGVHGALMVYEPRFNSTVLADILAIPTSKTLLRRHLNTLFSDLIGPQINQIKTEAELHSGFQPLSASNKLKQTKRIISVGGIFSHKRTKSQDSRDFFSGSISLLGYDDESALTSRTKMLMKNYKALADSNGAKKYNGNTNHSATLPMNSMVSFCEANGLCAEINSKKKEKKNNKLSILPSNNETLPTSIV